MGDGGSKPTGMLSCSGMPVESGYFCWDITTHGGRRESSWEGGEKVGDREYMGLKVMVKC